MRKITDCAALLIMAVALGSCQMQEPVIPGAACEYTEFYAEVEPRDPETKTFADEDGMVLWVRHDILSVFERKSNAVRYRYDGGTGTTAA